MVTIPPIYDIYGDLGDGLLFYPKIKSMRSLRSFEFPSLQPGFSSSRW